MKFIGPRLILLLAGIALGILARYILGVPEDSQFLDRSIDRPIGHTIESDSE